MLSTIAVYDIALHSIFSHFLLRLIDQWGVYLLVWSLFDESSSFTVETVTLSAVLERLGPHLAQIKVLHKVFCTGVAEVPPETPNVVRASHLLNTLYKAIIEYDNVGEASEQDVSLLLRIKFSEININRNVNDVKGEISLSVVFVC